MKKKLIIIGIILILTSMPALTAYQINEKPTNNTIFEKNLTPPPLKGYDGTFVGGLGQLYKRNGEWEFNAYAYLAGVYKLGVYKKLVGFIYDTDEQQIGSILAFFGGKLIIGILSDMENHRTPMIGFLMWNDEDFAGRILTMFGPATHIIGEYTPNS